MRGNKLVLFLILTLGTGLLSGCGTKTETAPSTGLTETGPVLKEVNGKADKPRYRIEDDYYEYINHTILDQKVIAPDSDHWSYFYELGNQAYEDLDGILKGLVDRRESLEGSSTQQRIADLYLSAMDFNSRDGAGFGKLYGYLDMILTAGTVQEYAEAIAWIGGEIPVYSLIPFTGDVDMKESSRYAWYLQKPDLGLGKEILEDEGQSGLWSNYKAYIAKIMALSGMKEEESVQSAEALFAFQKDLASACLPLADSSDPSKIYNLYSAEELKRMFSNIDLEPVLEKSKVPLQGQYIITEPEAVKKVNEYLTEEHLTLLKNYSVFCLLNDMANYLSQDFRDAYQQFNLEKTGICRKKSDERLAGEITQAYMQWDFGKLYVEHYFNEKDKQEIQAMASQILNYYGAMIDSLNWMGDDTKKAAIEKLRSMDLKIGYPDVWPDYMDSAQITGPSEGGILIDNILSLKACELKYRQKLFEGPVDKTIWQMTPQTVNAYYNPLANEIVFPAAILQAPFYDSNSGMEENLGGIGMVIAHEITHAFDNHGAQYDKDGNYHVWWSESDYARFNERAQAVVDYYNRYDGFQGYPVNGGQTLGENIADLGALSCVSGIAGNETGKLKKLFERYARIWASKYTDESMLIRLKQDVHSPARVRVNAVLSSTAAFYQAYKGLKDGDKMYVAPEKRVKIW